MMQSKEMTIRHGPRFHVLVVTGVALLFAGMAVRKHFPVDPLKPDKSFVDGLAEDEAAGSADDYSIARPIVGLGHTVSD